MIVYRISNHADLTGMGGELADGRWHTIAPGRRIVYLSDHLALSVLEILVHLDREEAMPDVFQACSVDVPDALLERVDDRLFTKDWQDNISLTQKIGDDWLLSRRSGALLVPSAVIPFATNCLLNPLVPEVSRLRLEVLGRFPFDRRLIGNRLP